MADDNKNLGNDNNSGNITEQLTDEKQQEVDEIIKELQKKELEDEKENLLELEKDSEIKQKKDSQGRQ